MRQKIGNYNKFVKKSKRCGAAKLYSTVLFDARGFADVKKYKARTT